MQHSRARGADHRANCRAQADHGTCCHQRSGRRYGSSETNRGGCRNIGGYVGADPIRCREAAQHG